MIKLPILFAGPIEFDLPLWFIVPLSVFFLLLYVLLFIIGALAAYLGFHGLKSQKATNSEAKTYKPLNLIIAYVIGLITESIMMLAACLMTLSFLTARRVQIMGYDLGSRTEYRAADQEIFIFGLILLVILRACIRLTASKLLFDKLLGVQRLAPFWRYGFTLFDILVLFIVLGYINSVPA